MGKKKEQVKSTSMGLADIQAEKRWTANELEKGRQRRAAVEKIPQTEQKAPVGLGAMKQRDKELQARRDYEVYKAVGEVPQAPDQLREMQRVAQRAARQTVPQSLPSLGAVKTLDRKLQERRDTNYQDVDRLRAQTAPMGLGAIKKLDQDLQAERDYAVYQTTGKLPGGEAGARTRVINTGWVKASVARDKAQEEVKRLQSEGRAPASSYLTGGAAQMATPYAVGAQAQKERQERDSELGRAKAALKKAESELAAWTDLWKDDQVQQAAAAVTKDPFAVTEALKKVREMPLDKQERRQAEQDVRGALYAAIAQSEEFKNWDYQDYHNVWDDDYYEKNPYDKYGMNLDITTSEAMDKAGETPVATEEEEKLLDFLIFKSHTDPAWRDNEDLTPNQYFQWWSTAISDPRVGKRWAEEAADEGVWGGIKMVVNHAARSSEDALAGLIGLERPQGANAYAEAEYRDKLDGFGRVVFDAANTVADMAPSMAAGAVFGPQAGLATMAAGAGGRSVERSLREGHGLLEAYGYGVLTAASEAMLGRLLGGISKVGGGSGVFSNIAGKSAENIQNGFLRFAAKVGLNSADEALEEYIQGVLDPVFRNIMLGEDNEVKLISEDAAYDAFMALITTPFLEGPTQARAEVNQARALSDWGRQIQEMGPEVADTVLRAGLDSAPSTDAYKLAAKLADQQAGGKRISDKDLGKLYQENVEAGQAKTQKTASTGETVKADTSLFKKSILQNLNQARSSFIEFARQHFPTSVKNAETGREIGISRTGLDKFLSGRIPYEKYASGFHIPELIERAHKIAQAENEHPGQVDSIPTYEYYDSPIDVDGTAYMAHIRVRNTRMGDKYYGHTISEIEDIKIEPSARTSAPGVTPAVQPVNAIDGSMDSIPQATQDVNLRGRSLGDRVAEAMQRDLKERGRAEEESKPLWERLAQVQAEGEAAMAQIEDRYGRAVAEREAEQAARAEGGETAEQGKTKSEPKLTKDTTGDTLQKKQGGRQFQSKKIFAKHYGKHSKEFGEISVEEYLRRANMLADSLLSDDVVELTRSDGSVARYRFSTNEFVVINADGTLRTYFKPELEGRYWERELERNN